MEINRGSEWRKWDLHVHTKDTNKNDRFKSKDFDSFCVDFFKKAIEKDIKAIGITDYFSIENYIKVKQFVAGIDKNDNFKDGEKDIIKKIFLLPNVELRMLPVTNKGKLVNIHCIFNPSYVQNLENDFFNSLEMNGYHRNYKINKDDLTLLGQSVDPNLQGDDAYIKGVENCVLTHQNLKDLFKNNSQLKENTIIVVSNSSTDGVSAFQNHYENFENEKGTLDVVRRSIYEMSDCIFSGNENDVKYFLGKKNDNAESVIKKCGSLKPCIHGSDAHTEEKLFQPDKDRYCWIKADTTFEGLKQILYEPEERVRIQQNKPDDKAGYQVIDTIKLTKKGFWEDTICLSENLNTIIGGRSTGKSTLLQSIAMNIQEDVIKDDKEDKKNFIKSHQDSISITWKDKEENKQRDIQYLPQNYMYQLARKEGQKEFDELIKKIIKNNLNDKLLEEYDKNNNEIEKELGKNIIELFQLQTQLEKNKEELKEKGDKNGIEKEIDNLNTKIKQLSTNADFTEDQQKTYERLKADINKKQEDINQLNKDIEVLESLKEISIFKEDTEYGLENLSEKVKQVVDVYLKQLKERVKENWEQKFNNIIVTEKDKLKGVINDKKEIEESEIIKKGTELINNNKELKEIEEKLKNEYEKYKAIIELEEKISDEENRINTLIDKILNKHYEYKTNRENLIKRVKIIHDNVRILSIPKDETEKMSEFLEFRFYLRGNERQDYVKNIVDNYNDIKFLRDFIKKAIANKIEFKNNYTFQQVLQEFLTTNWYSYSFDVIYQNDSFEQMSPGKKAFVVLKLLLDFDKRECPILIDQPEDSLDNRAIYNELVKYIRTKKKKRQIILVTHNPNVVVGADAENIIVANQHGTDNANENNNQFQYINGALESVRSEKMKKTVLLTRSIREHVCEILEGGKEAFEKREKKYDFK